MAVELAKLDSMDLLPMKGQHPKPYINHLQTLFKTVYNTLARPKEALGDGGWGHQASSHP